jgi:hypothetical protein
MGAMTFAAGPLAWLSDNAAIAFAQATLTYLLVPGLIVTAAVGSLVPAAVINALIHFAICFFVLRFVPAFKSKSLHDDTPFGA